MPTSQSPCAGPRRAFTLIELIVTLLILGALAAVAMIAFTHVTSRAQESRAQSDLRSAAQALLTRTAGESTPTLGREMVTDILLESFGDEVTDGLQAEVTWNLGYADQSPTGVHELAVGFSTAGSAGSNDDGDRAALLLPSATGTIHARVVSVDGLGVAGTVPAGTTPRDVLDGDTAVVPYGAKGDQPPAPEDTEVPEAPVEVPEVPPVSLTAQATASRAGGSGAHTETVHVQVPAPQGSTGLVVDCVADPSLEDGALTWHVEAPAGAALWAATGTVVRDSPAIARSYTCDVETVSASGAKTGVGTISATLEAAPTSPQMSAGAPAAGTASWHWVPVAGADSYEVRTRTAGGSWAAPSQVPGTEPVYTLTGQPAGAKLEAQVRAVARGQHSLWSDAIAVNVQVAKPTVHSWNMFTSGSTFSPNLTAACVGGADLLWAHSTRASSATTWTPTTAYVNAKQASGTGAAAVTAPAKPAFVEVKFFLKCQTNGVDSAVLEYVVPPLSTGGVTPTQGHADTVSAADPGQLRVSGWVVDDDFPTAAVSVHVYVDKGTSKEKSFNLGPANLSRPDVGAALPGRGNNHGFDQVLKLAPGTYSVRIETPGISGGGGLVLVAGQTVTVR